MKNAKTNSNFMTKNLQTNVVGIWLVPLKQYNKWIFWIIFFIGSKSVYTYQKKKKKSQFIKPRW